MGAAATTLVLALDGRWLLAGPCGVAAGTLLWLSGLWVSPWGSDGYARRLMHAWDRWATTAQWAYDAFADGPTRLDRRIERVRPPRVFELEHARLIGLLAHIEGVRADRSLPYPERVRRGVAAARAVDEELDHLHDTATEDDEQRYCRLVLEARDLRRIEYGDATMKAEGATEDLLRTLSRLRVPLPARHHHVALVRGVEAYLSAVRQFHAACQNQDADAAADAATEMESTIGTARASIQAILASLRYEARWPQSNDAPAER